MPGLFKIEDAYRFAFDHGLQAEATSIRDMPVHSAIRRPAAVRKGCLVELFESENILGEFVARHWPGRYTASGEKSHARYLAEKALNARLSSGESMDEDVDIDVDASTPSKLASFVLEAQLRDFVAQNLRHVPISGQRIQLYEDASGRDGIEYPTGVGPADILAVDEAGNLFVFELKLDRGPDRALGQLARYMGWLKVNVAGEHQVFGVIVARSIDERLRYAVTVMPNVTLLEYEVEFRLRNASKISCCALEAR
jgi:hypothetical protein